MRRTTVFQISRDAVEKLADRYGSPLLVLSLDEIKYKYALLKKHLPRVEVHYAIKANPHPAILGLLDRLGAGFDVASDGEIRQLYGMGIDGGRMSYANPVKTSAGLRACLDCSVTKMTFDSPCEIEKIRRACPGATVLLRLRVDNASALIDLNKKFGAGREDALALMKLARDAGLDMAGIAFHVGSQTPLAHPYLSAIDTARELFDQARAMGIDLRVLDIGGGFPIAAPNAEFDLPELLSAINEKLDADFPDTELWCEPGRYICGTAVNLITSVIGVTERGGKPWYFLDEGLYGTFSGILFDQWNFSLIDFKDGETVRATFAGPSCDSLDIVFRDTQTHRLEFGDLLLVPSCGAYTSASATTFNGFGKTPFVIWEEVKDTLALTAEEKMLQTVERLDFAEQSAL